MKIRSKAMKTYVCLMLNIWLYTDTLKGAQDYRNYIRELLLKEKKITIKISFIEYIHTNS